MDATDESFHIQISILLVLNLVFYQLGLFELNFITFTAQICTYSGCLNGGQCISDDSGDYCVCPEGTTGLLCQTGIFNIWLFLRQPIHGNFMINKRSLGKMPLPQKTKTTMFWHRNKTVIALWGFSDFLCNFQSRLIHFD